MATFEKDISWYCWLVNLSLVICGVLYSLATNGSSSVLVFIWIEKFKLPLETIVWIPTTRSAFVFLTGPLVTVMMHKLGTWQFTVVGGVLMCGGAVTTAFATEFWHLIITHGVIQGLAAGIVQLCATDMVGIYFEKHKDKVHSLLIMSKFIGYVIGPTLTEYLIDTTSYKHALLIEASLCLLIFPCALIFRGPAQMRRFNDDTDSPNSGEVNANYQPDITDETDAENRTGRSDGNSGSSEITRHMFVLKQPIFILFIVFIFLVSLTENTFFAVAVDYTVNAGVFDLKQAALAMTFLGTCTVGGSLFITIISHWQLDRNLLMIISAFLLGLAVILMPFANASTPMYMYVIFMIFGLFESLYVVSQPSWIVGQFNHSNLMIIRFSYVLFTNGVGTAIGPIMAGYFAKALTPDAMLYLLGSFPMLAAILIVPYWIKLKRSGNVPLLKSAKTAARTAK